MRKTNLQFTFELTHLVFYLFPFSEERLVTVFNGNKKYENLYRLLWQPSFDLFLQGPFPQLILQFNFVVDNFETATYYFENWNRFFKNGKCLSFFLVQ